MRIDARQMFSASCLAIGAACGGVEVDPREGRPSNLSVTAFPPATSFEDTITIELKTSRPARIYYSTDGGSPDASEAHMYRGPLELSEQTLLSFFAISEDGVWSAPGSELYLKPDRSAAPATSPRLLHVEKEALFFDAQPGQTDPIERRVLIRSMGSDAVRIQSVHIARNPNGRGFFDPGAFEMIAGHEVRELGPGNRMELRIAYYPSETFRSAMVVIRSDATANDGIQTVELWGRTTNW